MKKELQDLVSVDFEEGIVPLTISEEGETFIINHGIMKKGVNSSFNIIITEKENSNITKVKPLTSCGCTVARSSKIGNVNTVKVKYDTKRMGTFKKGIGVNIYVGREMQTIFFRLTGKVIS